MPDLHDLPDDEIGRRQMLKLLGTAAALAGIACDPPREKILPYVRQPPEVSPGRPLHYATSIVMDGYATGVLAATREGRPIKIEGNPEHPASLGATSALHQASVLDLYDPRRARSVRHGGDFSDWRSFVDTLLPNRRGLRFLMPPQTSPLHRELFDEITRRHPDARFSFYAPLDRTNAERAARIAYGDSQSIQYRFQRAKVVVALDADFTHGMAMSVRWAHDFAARRRLDAPHDDTNRLYAVEPMRSITGTLADHRLAVRAHDVPRIAAGLLATVLDELGQVAVEVPASLRDRISSIVPESHRSALVAMARDLVRNRGAGLVIAGDQQPTSTHLVAHLLNHVLGNVDSTVTVTSSARIELPNEQSLEELLEDMQRGMAETLVIVELDPVHCMPAEVEFRELLRRVRHGVHLSLYRGQTSLACEWHLPASHYLETWGDARAYDGTVSFVQPVIRPLYDTRSVTSVLADFAGRFDQGDYRLLRAHWSNEWVDEFEPQWEGHIQRGLLSDSAFSALPSELKWPEVEAELNSLRDKTSLEPELHFESSPSLYDGRFANNGWLQELPHPITKITWGNAAIMSPARARAVDAERGDVVRLRIGGWTMEAPVYVLPGHADDSVTLTLGYGQADGLGNVGVNAYPLRSSRHGVLGLHLEKTGRREELAITQDHGLLHGRDLALRATLPSYREDPRRGVERRAQPSLLPVVLDTSPEQWAMTIDTMICTGCSACVTACQAENNVPVVGPDEVRRGREMHWLRIDRYFVEDESDIVNQPMACQHCEKAPCEYVCPVNATVHSPDGLNEMVYNRCVGTRFCSNNCPYKVRRFNWFDYESEAPISMQRNPDVTVRERGVMEKCTYCVQRIRRGQRNARREERALRPGEVVPACAQACPTQAIQFGLLHHEDSDMVRWRRQPRAYSVLHELGTKPRTHYLAKITNPNPEFE